MWALSWLTVLAWGHATTHAGTLSCPSSPSSFERPSLLRPQHRDKPEELRHALWIRGGALLAGRHPFGYRMTALGEEFLEFEGSLDSDVGRFLASFKSTLTGSRKTKSSVKSEWLEILR